MGAPGAWDAGVKNWGPVGAGAEGREGLGGTCAGPPGGGMKEGG